MLESFQIVEKEPKLPDSFCNANITLLLKVDQYITKRKKLFSSMNVDVKILYSM